MLVLGVDTETTGLSVQSSRVVEFSMVMWEPEKKIPIQIYSGLLFRSDFIPIEQGATAAHGLDRDYLFKYGRDPEFVLGVSLKLAIEECDAVCAHNGNGFDKPLLQNEFKRYGLEWPEKTWIDTSTDIEYPPEMKSRSLRYLAADHGIYFPKERRHRSIHDVFTMLEILGHYDIEQVIKSAKAPLIKLWANVTYETKHLAKDRRFQWDMKAQGWFKMVKEFNVEKEISECGFKVTKDEKTS